MGTTLTGIFQNTTHNYFYEDNIPAISVSNKEQTKEGQSTSHTNALSESQEENLFYLRIKGGVEIVFQPS